MFSGVEKGCIGNKWVNLSSPFFLVPPKTSKLWIRCFCIFSLLEKQSFTGSLNFSDLFFRKLQKNCFSWSYSLSSIDRKLIQCNNLLKFICFNKKKFNVSMFVTQKNKVVLVWETIWLAWLVISLTEISLIWKIFLTFILSLYGQGRTGPLAEILPFEGEISVSMMNTSP